MKDTALERGEEYCIFCPYFKRVYSPGDPAVANESDYDISCTREKGKDKTACARASKNCNYMRRTTYKKEELWNLEN